MKKNGKFIALIIAAALLILAAAGGYLSGRKAVSDDLEKEKAAVSRVTEELQELQLQRDELAELNKSSIMSMVLDDGPIYVIGHKSPDSDTVCSAIAYARLLQKLGFDAIPMLNGEPNNESNYILEQAGIPVPEILDDAAGKNIFLVDHSEYMQSTKGMNEAHIVGILDHHGVGSVTTGNMVVYEGRPIGATATIVWLDYLNYGLVPDDDIAYILLCTIFSDTATLTSSTVTDADRKAVEALAKQAGIDDTDALARKLHEELLSYEGFTDIEILFSDYKEYEAFGTKFGIGCVNAIDEETASELAARMKAVLPEGFASKEVGLMYAEIGIRENGEKIDYVVPVDELSKQIFEQAFPDYDEYDGTAFIFRKGCGRKTVFVPGLTDFLATQPHD
ncbi:MAG: DHH family phosphoesterase [Oscillospiraceae bacterium]|nr:DHH family phosphoesterase [Oscillospiraceae bacterium]